MTQPKRLKSLRWLAFVLLGMVLFCCGGSFTTLMVSRYSSERRLQEKLEQLSIKGIPVDDASVAALHETLTSTENVDVWIGILDRFASQNFLDQCKNVPLVGKNEDPIPKLGDPWTDQALVEQLMAQNADTMKQLLDIAQDNGPVRYPIEFKSLGTLLPHVQNTRSAARMLMLEAILAARAGDADREFRAINAMIGCAISVRGEPFIVSQLVSIGVHGMTVNRLQKAVEANRLSAEQLEMLRTRLAPFSDIKHSFTVSSKGEIGMAMPAFRDPATISPQLEKLSTLIVSSGLADRAARKHAERMEEALEIQTGNLKNFMADLQAWENQPLNGGMLEKLEGSISQQLAPVMSGIGSALVRSKMVNDLTTIAIAARQYEMANGQLAKNLEELKKQGIDLSLFHCVDGNLPNYLLVDPAKPIDHSSEASASTESSKESRAILWSFNPTKSVGNLNPSLSPTPPAKLNNEEQSEETDAIWWRWDLQ